ncbi:MAG: pyrroloquinoline quinone-dependent dehydrogenase, partial [Gemmatimonadota bacterium]
SGPVAGWDHYGGGPGGLRHSPLTPISPENVRSLEVAWSHRTGDVSDGGRHPRRSAFQATPILFRGTLYVSTVFSRLIALDPETGDERWTYDPGLDLTVRYAEHLTSRGVTAWADPEAESGEPCAARIFLPVLDARIVAVDAVTGRPCTDFGEGGEIDLKLDVGDVDEGQYILTSPPVVVDGVLVTGSAMGDNRRVEVELGIVRGYDARTGALLWKWDPIPRSPAADAWPEWTPEAARRTGAGNAWAPLAADPERGLVFVPTGSASPDFYGGERPGTNRHANSVVALGAATGDVAWSFQAVHHDLWDYDVPSQPLLADVPVDGRLVPAVVQATKMGHVFVLHRATGEPLHPVEERPVPPSEVPGEAAWPTQPFPTHPGPLLPARFTPDSAWGLTPWDRGRCREKLAALRYDGPFTPPSFEGTLIAPSYLGGSNWGGAAYDAGRRLLVLNMNRVASIARVIPRMEWEAEVEGPGRREGEYAAQLGTPYGLHREHVVLSPLGMPCTPPPWGVLVAVDMETGEEAWRVPLGTIRDLAPVPLPIRLGVPNMGGPVLTASGLVFIGAAADNYLRAFDVETGEELWKGRLPAGGQATPMTYRLTPDGRQFIVIAAGGHGGAGTDLGDELVAFALRER